MIKRPKHIIFTGHTRWSGTWLGSFNMLYNPQEAAAGRYSRHYKHWKRVVFPLVASQKKVGGEKIRIKIDLS